MKKRIFKVVKILSLIILVVGIAVSCILYLDSKEVDTGKFLMKSGYVDKTGKEVIPLKYVRVGYFSNGLAVVSNKRDLCGVIDKTGKLVIPFKYSYIHPFKNGLAIVMKKREYISIHGNAKYHSYLEAVLKEKGFFSILMDYDMGVIDKNDKEILPIKYDFISSNDNDIFLVGVRNSGKNEEFYLDKNGKRLFRSFDRISMFFNGYALVSYKYKETLDKNGNLKLTRDYSNTPPSVSFDSSSSYYCNLINTNGNKLLPLKYFNVSYVCNGLAYVKKKVVISKKDLKKYWTENTAHPNIKSSFYYMGLYGLVDVKSHKEIVPCDFDEIKFHDPDGYDFYYIDCPHPFPVILEDNVISNSKLKNFMTSGYLVMGKRGKYFVVDTNGKMYPINYYNVGGYGEGLVCAGKVTKDSKYVIEAPSVDGLDGNNKKFATYEEAFEYIKKNKAELYSIKPTNVKYGYVNIDGKEIIPFIYDNGYSFKDGKALVTQDNRNFYIDKKGKILYNEDQYENKETEKYFKKGDLKEGFAPVVKLTLLGRLVKEVKKIWEIFGF